MNNFISDRLQALQDSSSVGRANFQTLRNSYLSANRFASEPKSLSSAGILDSFGNMFTGNLDYQRQIESADRANEHSAEQARIAYERSSEEARKLREYETYMSNTAYSRAIADLRRNGINPYAIGHFSPASTPTASVGTAFQGHTYASGATSGTGTAGFRFLLDLFTIAAKMASAMS